MSREYTIETEEVNESKKVLSNCNAIQFINRGDNTAVVNGETIATDQFIINNGDAGETDVTNYDIRFIGSGSQQIFIRRKIYK